MTLPDKVATARAWRTMMPDVLLGGPPQWNKVKGPIGATIATLHSVGWTPVKPNELLAPGGESKAVLDAPEPSAHTDIEATVCAAVESLWRSASKHVLGGGLETGEPSF